MMGQKPKEKPRNDADKQRMSSREADLLLVYEDKTLILFGKPKKNSTIKKV